MIFNGYLACVIYNLKRILGFPQREPFLGFFRTLFRLPSEMNLKKHNCFTVFVKKNKYIKRPFAFKRTDLLDIPNKHTSLIEFFSLFVFYSFPCIFINSVELKFSSNISVIILYQQRTLKDRYICLHNKWY